MNLEIKYCSNIIFSKEDIPKYVPLGERQTSPQGTFFLGHPVVKKCFTNILFQVPGAHGSKVALWRESQHLPWHHLKVSFGLQKQRQVLCGPEHWHLHGLYHVEVHQQNQLNPLQK